jgi:hypothetical protein
VSTMAKLHDGQWLSDRIELGLGEQIGEPSNPFLNRTGRTLFGHPTRSAQFDCARIVLRTGIEKHFWGLARMVRSFLAVLSDFISWLRPVTRTFDKNILRI